MMFPDVISVGNSKAFPSSEDITKVRPGTTLQGTNLVGPLGQYGSISAFDSIVIGQGATAFFGSNLIAIGNGVAPSSQYFSIMIGYQAGGPFFAYDVIAIGRYSSANGQGIAIGKDTDAGPDAIAIGLGADAGYDRSIAIGSYVTTNRTDSLRMGPNDTNVVEVDNSAVAGDTALLVYDVDNAQVERVSVGAADSGGVGYKVLRIPN